MSNDHPAAADFVQKMDRQFNDLLFFDRFGTVLRDFENLLFHCSAPKNIFGRTP